MNKIIASFVAFFLTCTTACYASAEPSQQALEDGRQVYKKWCSECHDDGAAFPGTNALRVKYKGVVPAVPAVLLKRTDLTPEFIKYYVRNGFSAMPIFRKTEVSDAQLQALTAYLTQPKEASAPGK